MQELKDDHEGSVGLLHISTFENPCGKEIQQNSGYADQGFLGQAGEEFRVLVDFSHSGSNGAVEEERGKKQRKAKNEESQSSIGPISTGSWMVEAQNHKRYEIKEYDERKNPREGLEHNLMFFSSCQVAPEPYENQNHHWKNKEPNDIDGLFYWILWNGEGFMKLG